ncbi:MAG: right-handed parallel beta-helix repeat-containing protein [Candidatus Thermoplasmatota archaeon]|nr:right-handed parallel beta-helix repeat-containing protein [Candidatus Thermoplasmatota archaeon]
MDRRRSEVSSGKEDRCSALLNRGSGPPLIDGTGLVEEEGGASDDVNDRGTGTGAIIAAFVIAGLLVIGSLNIFMTLEVGDDGYFNTPPVANSSLVPHDPIRIDNDGEFATTASMEGWQGNGSEGNPYLIGGYEIDASGDKEGIMMGNTTVYFVIADCYISGSSDSGIKLLNARNGLIENVVCYSCGYHGIYLYSATDNAVVNVSCSGNSIDGIGITDSPGNSLAECNCSHNSGDGISIYSSSWTELVDVFFLENGQNGVRMDLSDDCSIISCEFNRCTSDGVYCVDCANATVSWNYMASDRLVATRANGLIVANNTGYSSKISATSCNQSCFCDNYLSVGAGGSMIYLYRSDGVRIRNNTCAGAYASGAATAAVYVWECSNVTLDENECNPAPGAMYSRIGYDPCHGIWARSTTNVIVTDNICCQNLGAGIAIDSCENASVLGNSCSFNDWRNPGIWISWSPAAEVRGNNCSDNYGDGMFVTECDSSVIVENVCSNNDYGGICVYSSEGAILSDNNCSGTGENGIKLRSLQGCLITGNMLFGNRWAGIELNSTSNCTLRDNLMGHDGVVIVGTSLSNWNTHDIDTSNLVNDNPARYIKNQTGGTVLEGAGQVILANCVDVEVRDQVLVNASMGLQLGYSHNNDIFDNMVMYNDFFGIHLYASDGNEIWMNGIAYNIYYGVKITSGTGNRVWNNTFVDNNGVGSTYHAQAYTVVGNFWNSSTHGNCWSDWPGPDSNYDGIVDVPYDVDPSPYSEYYDYYPLVAQPVFVPEFSGVPVLALASLLVMAYVLVMRGPRSPRRSR